MHMLLQMQGPRSDLKDGEEGLKSGGGRRMGLGGSPPEKVLLKARKWLFWKPYSLFNPILVVKNCQCKFK